MKIIGELKERVEKAETLEEKKKAIEEAGFELSDEEMEAVTGGFYRLGFLDVPCMFMKCQ